MPPLSLALLLATQPAADPLVEAARARQAAAKSVEVEFRVEEFRAKGSASVPRPPAPPHVGQIPPADLRRAAVNRLVLDGPRVRFENNNLNIMMLDGSFLHKTAVHTFDGTTSRTVLPAGLGPTSAATGVIEREARADTSTACNPLTVHFRGLDPAVSPCSLAALRKSGRVQVIGDGECEEYLAPDLAEETAFWFDPRRGYVLVRQEHRRGEAVTGRIDVRYREHAGGLVPGSWVWTTFGPAGRELTRTTVEVVSLRLNPELPAGLFGAPFPPGCRVSDKRTGQEFVVGPSGEMEEVRRDRRPAEGSGQEAERPRRTGDLFVGIAAGVILLVTVWVTRRTRRARHRPAQT